MHVRMHKKYFVRLRWESKDIHIHIYILFTGNDLTIWNTSLSVRTTHNIVLIRQLVNRKIHGCVDRRSRELFVSHYRRRRRLFSSLIIIMIRVVHCHHGSRIRDTRWSLVALVDRVIIVRLTIIDGLSIIVYVSCTKSCVRRSSRRFRFFQRLTCIVRTSRMERSRELLQVWKRKNTKKEIDREVKNSLLEVLRNFLREIWINRVQLQEISTDRTWHNRGS